MHVLKEISLAKMYHKMCNTLHCAFCFCVLAIITAGTNGHVNSSYLQKVNLERSAKDRYPLHLIKLMTRYAEDLVWINNVTDAEAVFNFTLTLTEGRADASQLRNGKFIHQVTYKRQKSKESGCTIRILETFSNTKRID